MIESNAIRYFREVTQCGSIKQAAVALRIAPSAISRQVQALEQELAVKLFERGARGMNLTDAGHVLYRYAVENRNQLDSIRARVEAFDVHRRGLVRLATVEGLLASFLVDLVVDLNSDYPGISVAVTAVGSRDVAEMVSQQSVDLGLVFGRAPRRDLIELARMRQSLCLLVSRDHPMANRDFCHVRELAGLRAVMPDQSFGIRQEIDRACAQAGVSIDICTEINSLAFARAIVAQTDLVTFLPRIAAQPELIGGTLVAIPLRDKRLEATQVTLVQLASRSLSPSSRLVADIMIARMQGSRRAEPTGLAEPVP